MNAPLTFNSITLAMNSNPESLRGLGTKDGEKPFLLMFHREEDYQFAYVWVERDPELPELGSMILCDLEYQLVYVEKQGYGIEPNDFFAVNCDFRKVLKMINATPAELVEIAKGN